MKNVSNDLVHRINNQFGLLISSIDALHANIDDKEYCKEVISEIKNKSDDFSKMIEDLKLVVGKE
ncbi:MAG: hypothetical protein ACOYL6_17490 [Bacteriovoracaceae bacterium]